MPRFLRALAPRVDDMIVYGQVSPGDEWAVPGGFAYGDGVPGPGERARRAAFEQCFLGVESFAHVAVVEVAEIDAADLAQLRVQLALQMVNRLGAPGLGAALPVADDEIAYTLEIAELPVGTRLVIERSVDEDGEIHESLRRVQVPAQEGAGAGGGLDHEALRLWGVEPGSGDASER